MSYEIEGILGIAVKEKTIKFKLKPNSSYLTPDKKSAVLFEKNSSEAKVRKLEDGFLEFDEDSDESKIKDILIQLALQQKQVKVEVEVEVEDKKLKIISFTYPIR